MGYTTVWNFPMSPALDKKIKGKYAVIDNSNKDIAALNWAIDHLSEYQKFAKDFKKIINESPYLQWNLVPFLLDARIFKANFPLGNTGVTNPLAIADTLRSLVTDGAQYKHTFFGYGILDDTLLNVVFKIFGKDATIYPIQPGDYIASVLCQAPKAFNLVKIMLYAGAEVNLRIDKEFSNTILHYFIAMEHGPSPLKFINLVEAILKSSDKPKDFKRIDYTLQDSRGRTPLHLAVGLNQTAIVKRLLKISQEEKIEVGIDVTDQYQRTPLMTAAALGHLEIYNALIENQANSQTNDYEMSSSETVAKILSSFSVHPDKDITASDNHSYLYAQEADGCPLVLVANDGTEQQLVLSTKEPHLSLLKKALELVSLEEKQNVQYQINSIMDRNKPMHGISITELCIKNQKAIREIIQNQKSLKMIETNLSPILSIHGNNSDSATEILEAKQPADDANLTSDNQPELSKDSLFSGVNTLFNTADTQNLIKKYQLTNATQVSLEEGLRNAADQGSIVEMKI